MNTVGISLDFGRRWPLLVPTGGIDLLPSGMAPYTTDERGLGHFHGHRVGLCLLFVHGIGGCWFNFPGHSLSHVDTSVCCLSRGTKPPPRCGDLIIENAVPLGRQSCYGLAKGHTGESVNLKSFENAPANGCRTVIRSPTGHRRNARIFARATWVAQRALNSRNPGTALLTLPIETECRLPTL